MKATRKLSTEKTYYVPVNPEHVRKGVTVKRVKFIEDVMGTCRCEVLDYKDDFFTDYFAYSEMYDTEAEAQEGFINNVKHLIRHHEAVIGKLNAWLK